MDLVVRSDVLNELFEQTEGKSDDEEDEEVLNLTANDIDSDTHDEETHYLEPQKYFVPCCAHLLHNVVKNGLKINIGYVQVASSDLNKA